MTDTKALLVDSTKWEEIQKRDFQAAAPKLLHAVADGCNKGYDFERFSQDLFSLCYKTTPTFPESATPGTAWAKKALDELQTLPEFNQLREADTKCNAFRSGLATTVLAKRFAESLEEVTDENPDTIQEHLDALNKFIEDVGDNEAKTKALKADLEKALVDATESWDAATEAIDPSTIRQAARKAIAGAKSEIEAVDEAVQGFGIGSGPGDDGYANLAEKIKIAELLANNDKLQEIAKLAGRFKAEARKQQSNKKAAGPDEITDIEIGNDLGRLIPAELVKLNNPLTKLLFYKGYSERSLIQYKLEAVEKKAKGPIIFCLDSSGSMSGPKDVWSKAIALALAQIAMDQDRTFEIIHFTGHVERKDVFPAGKSSPEKLAESCAYFAGGGTCFDPPLTEAFKDIKEAAEKDLKDADVIFITDGFGGVQADVVNEAKKDTGASIYTICLGGYVDDLEKISDKITYLKDLSKDREVKETIFSI
jgi:uncharacterized protein with von Willebrand factor type A (vWA) domain